MNQNQNLKDLAKQGIDGLGHSSVQPWSAGPIFPAVIAKVERYAKHDRFGNTSVLWARFETQWWELTLDGVTEQYATREDAELVAIALIGDPVMRARWSWHGSDGAEHRGSLREHAQYLAACERSVREGVAA